jgi:hypothetical protein
MSEILSQKNLIYFSKGFLFQKIFPMASDIYHLNFENFSKVFLYDKDDKIIASGTLVSYDSQAQILDSSITLREENSNETYTDFSKIGEIYTDFSKIGFEMTIMIWKMTDTTNKRRI